MKKTVLILLCAALLWTLPACGTSPEESGRAVVKDNKLIISLESNPSTGYGWEYRAEGEPCFSSEAEHEYIMEEHDLPLSGAPGTEVFTFTAEADGKTRLHFAYLRSFEENSTIRSYELSVSVSDGKIRILNQEYKEQP